MFPLNKFAIRLDKLFVKKFGVISISTLYCKVFSMVMYFCSMITDKNFGAISLIKTAHFQLIVSIRSTTQAEKHSRYMELIALEPRIAKFR